MPSVVEFVVRTSLIATVVALVLLVMRIRAAAARHAVWVAVLFAMLLLPAWLTFGPKLSLPLLPKEPGTSKAVASPIEVVMPATSFPTEARPSAPASRRFEWTWAMFAAGLYLLGGCTLLLRLAIGTARINTLLRSAIARNGMLTHPSCSTPITVGWLRPSIILPDKWSDWPQPRLDAILAHELEHIRRRDPLFQWIALLNRALFWFHPLAWWLEQQLRRLAEEACDQAVLAQGHDPREYSQALLDLARSVNRTGMRIHAQSMAMPGPFLSERIHRLMNGAPIPKISRQRLAWTTALCSVAAAILATSTLIRAQSNSAKSGDNPKFEVASIRRSAYSSPLPPPPGAPGILLPSLDRQRLSLSSSLAGLIVVAYAMRGCGLGPITVANCALLSGGPSWLRKDYFDLQAKLPDNTPAYTLPQFWESRAPEIQLMLQALLTERFNLEFHHESRELPVYVLTLARGGSKLKKAAGGTMQFPDGTVGKDEQITFMPANFDPKAPADSLSATEFQMIIKNRTLQALTEVLSNMMDRPVLDRTRVEGEFDITMKYERDTDAEGRLQIYGPSFFSALREQLGLVLQPTKAPVDIFVIDHADPPSEN